MSFTKEEEVLILTCIKEMADQASTLLRTAGSKALQGDVTGAAAAAEFWKQWERFVARILLLAGSGKREN